MIDSFDKDYKFLSNFYPVKIHLSRITFPSAEHAYQAVKSVDLRYRRSLISMTAGQAKRSGRKIRLRDKWEDIKEELMLKIVRLKFVHPNLADLLKDTGVQELIEGNYWHDSFWGICYCDKHKGIGNNALGKILMKVREELKTE